MRVPQILAMYLPQFHKVKENDAWWGEGFTEWNTVRLARPLFSDHKQPVQPIEYYNLLDKDVMEKQAKYMRDYGVDGMCFYHYYFEGGKKILEKPAENLLQWEDIDMPFCFYWANESWIRSWSNIEGNSWSELFESKTRPEEDSVLLKQDYGGEMEWIDHFYYLLPFFKDSRYLKKDGHPIFMIYQPGDIEYLKDMKDCWNKLMNQEEMSSIYFIGRGTDCEILENALIHEPFDAMSGFYENRFQNEYGLQFFLNYDEIWERILRKRYIQKNVCLGGFVGFDDTPRRGGKGKVIYGGTPEKFKKYMMRLLLKAGNVGSEMVFINAWNEWGEGMYLEPDRQWEFQYLEALRAAKEFAEMYGDMIQESNLDYDLTHKNSHEELEALEKKNERYMGYWKSLKRWLELNLQHKSICDFFVHNQYDKIAIYGIGILGAPLIQDMQNCKIPIAYGIDQDVHKGKGYDFITYQLEDSLPEADLIVVTVGYAFDSIKAELSKKINGHIIPFNVLLDFVEKETG